MSPIYTGHVIYDVSVSVDGFIAGPDADISRFAHEGPIVDDYLQRLAGYSVALMGRRTYEFGYRFGLTPGANPYPRMRSVVLSRTIDLPDGADVEVVRGDAVAFVEALKREANGSGTEGPIYLCGGGELAGSLARTGLIDRLRLKRVPVVLGGGTALLGRKGAALELRLASCSDYGGGALLQEFETESVHA